MGAPCWMLIVIYPRHEFVSWALLGPAADRPAGGRQADGDTASPRPWKGAGRTWLPPVRPEDGEWQGSCALDTRSRCDSDPRRCASCLGPVGEGSTLSVPAPGRAGKSRWYHDGDPFV